MNILQAVHAFSQNDNMPIDVRHKTSGIEYTLSFDQLHYVQTHVEDYVNVFFKEYRKRGAGNKWVKLSNLELINLH